MMSHYRTRIMQPDAGHGAGGTRGTVMRWLDRRFGFIARDDGGPDLFVHIRNVVGRVELKPGDRVSFEVGDYHGRPEAQNVRPVA